MKFKKIILVGMMGCGKTTISNELSKKLGIPCFDIDFIFEQNEKIKIVDFFKKYSQDEFRLKESLILKNILENSSNSIISTGGGIVLKKDNRDMIFNNDDFLSIYLKTSTNVIYDRIKDDKTRPLLLVDDPKTKIKEIIIKREQFYSLAKKVIITDNKTVSDIVKEIIELV